GGDGGRLPAAAGRGAPARTDPPGRGRRGGAPRAPLPEGEVVLVGPSLVAVPFDEEQSALIRLQPLGVLVERALVPRPDVVLVEVEVDVAERGALDELLRRRERRDRRAGGGSAAGPCAAGSAAGARARPASRAAGARARPAAGRPGTAAHRTTRAAGSAPRAARPATAAGHGGTGAAARTGAGLRCRLLRTPRQDHGRGEQREHGKGCLPGSPGHTTLLSLVGLRRGLIVGAATTWGWTPHPGLG